MIGNKRKVDSTTNDDIITSSTNRSKNNNEDKDDNDDNYNDNNSRNAIVNENKNDKTNDYDSNNNYVRQCVLPKALFISNDHNIKYLKIITWNVNGFTSLYNKNLNKLLNLFKLYQPDILCLQETKIQENLVNNYQYLINDYVSYWNCSTVKKGIYIICSTVNKRVFGTDNVYNDHDHYDYNDIL